MNKKLKEYGEQLPLVADLLKEKRQLKDELEEKYKIEEARTLMSSEVMGLASQPLRDAQLRLNMESKEIHRQWLEAKHEWFRTWLDYEVLTKLIDIQLKAGRGE